MSQGIIIVLVSVYHFCFLVCLVFFLLLFQVQSPSVRAYSVTNLIFFFQLHAYCNQKTNAQLF